MIPVEGSQDEDKEAAWSKIPNIPMRYHVYFQLLDGDEAGRPARIKDDTTQKLVPNPQFDHRTLSGLYLIANSPFNNVSFVI